MTKDAVAGRIRSGLTRSRGHRAPVGFARMCLSCGVTQVLLVVIGLLLIGLPLLALVADRGQSPPRRRASQNLGSLRVWLVVSDCGPSLIACWWTTGSLPVSVRWSSL